MTISPAVGRVLLEGCTASDLRHLAACLEARDHVPDDLAIELADELAAMVEKNTRPTIAWYRKRAQRIAAARGAS